MKLGFAILARLGLAAEDQPDVFEERLKLMAAASATPMRMRRRAQPPALFKNRPAHQAA